MYVSPAQLYWQTPNLNHLHHKTHNADNVSQTNYCKCGHLHFSVIIVHVKSALRAIGRLNTSACILVIWLENKPIRSVV